MEVGSGQAGEARQHKGWQLSNALENGCHFYWRGKARKQSFCCKSHASGESKNEAIKKRRGGLSTSMVIGIIA